MMTGTKLSIHLDAGMHTKEKMLKESKFSRGGIVNFMNFKISLNRVAFNDGFVKLEYNSISIEHFHIKFD